MRLRIDFLAACLAPAVVFAQAASYPAAASAPQATANPAMAPVHASTAGSRLPPVQPAQGVTRHVQQAAEHDVDAEGHTLDPHGKPVGQAPAPPSTR